MSVNGSGARRTDVVVVGGGIVGICVALYLQRSGRNVVVVERERPGHAASGHNGGVFSIGECLPIAIPGVIRSVPGMLLDPLSPLAIRWSYLPRLSPWLVRFALSSRRRRVDAISGALHSLTKPSFDAYRPLLDGGDAAAMVKSGGMLVGYRDEGAYRSAAFAAELRTRRGVSFEVLDDAGVGELDPQLAGRFFRGVHLTEPRYTPDPESFTQALAAQFVVNGGHIEPAEVDGFEHRNGQVHSVHTTRGTIHAETVVIAAGAWSRRLVRKLGFDLPLDTERGYGVHLPEPGVSLRFPILCRPHQFALTPAGGGLRLAGTDELAGLSAPPNYERADKLIQAARTVFPELRIEGAQKWMSFRPSMPDSLPVIGRVPRLDNVYAAFGHGHKGLTLAAITGQLVQELVEGKPTSINLEPFSPTRFSLLPWRRRADDHKHSA